MESLKRTLRFIFNHPLSGKHPYKSLFRFAKWQIQTLLFPHKFFVKDFVNPVKIYVKKGLYGLTGNIYTGLHEFDDMGFLLHFLRPQDVFFDIGANAGSYTLLAAGVCKTQTIAIEAATPTFQILNQNIALNNLQHKVTALNVAAGAQNGVVNFTTSEDAGNHVATQDMDGSQPAQQITMIPIDTLLDHHSPTLIKIDVEGFETEVLRGMKETLQSTGLKAIIIELNGCGARYGFDESLVHALLLNHGFKPYTYNPFTRVLKATKSYGPYNTIYCRDIDMITQRLSTAIPFEVMGQRI